MHNQYTLLEKIASPLQYSLIVSNAAARQFYTLKPSAALYQ